MGTNKGWTYDKELARIRNPYAGLYSNTLRDEDTLSTINTETIDVNDTIKPIDEKDANVEIESNEVVLQPNGKVFRALGKKHKYGGTPVNLPNGSFIYSNHNTLSLSREDKELFNFKGVGTKKSVNTPANVIQREVDIKHHNQMIAIQDSAKHDDISKTSSQLMLQKNFTKLGQVAFLQEEKKGFPEGIPGFSQGTAPIKDENVDVMTKQYKEGGFVQLQAGGTHRTYRGAKYRRDFNVPPDATLAGEETVDGENFDYFNVGKAQQARGPLMPNSQWLQFLKNESPQHRANRLSRQNGVDRVYNSSGPAPIAVQDQMSPIPIQLPQYNPQPVAQLNPPSVEIPGTPGASEDNGPILPYEPNVPLTPAQKASLAYTAYNAASVRKYQPKRAQTSFVPVNLERINSQPMINQVNAQASQAYAANQVMNPYIARASNSSIFGKLLDQSSRILGNVANQNSQISNQENMYNNQGINRTSNQNVALDSKYYDQVTAMNQNYDNEKRFANNRVADQYFQYRSQNDSLEMQLASQPTMGSVDVWQDPKTGRTSRTAKPGWVQRKQAAPLYDYNPYRNRIQYTGAGINLDNLPAGSGNNITQIYAQNLLTKVQNGTATEDEKKSLALIASRMKQ